MPTVTLPPRRFARPAHCRLGRNGIWPMCLHGALGTLRLPRLGWKATGHDGGVPRALTLPASEPDMSDRRGRNTSQQSYDADQFVRCVACWCWFNRRNSVSAAAHRGPLPHPAVNLRTAWADED